MYIQILDNLFQLIDIEQQEFELETSVFSSGKYRDHYLLEV